MGEIKAIGAQAIRCPACGVDAGQSCVNPLTNKPYKLNAPHIERIREAGK